MVACKDCTLPMKVRIGGSESTYETVIILMSSMMVDLG